MLGKMSSRDLDESSVYLLHYMFFKMYVHVCVCLCRRPSTSELRNQVLSTISIVFTPRLYKITIFAWVRISNFGINVNPKVKEPVLKSERREWKYSFLSPSFLSASNSYPNSCYAQSGASCMLAIGVIPLVQQRTQHNTLRTRRRQHEKTV
jgi:hypothetical protein